MSRGTVRQGGKEELRASVLKTYLLRVRGEMGERAVRQLLGAAGIDASIVDNERGWVSAGAAKRALRAIEQLLGEGTLEHRGEWVTHPEALGTLVRMLRVSSKPIDAYRYVADNAKEVTRLGTWEIGEAETKDRRFGLGGTLEKVTMSYRIREEGGEEGSDHFDAEGEGFLCKARQGELASIPKIWGLPEAGIEHDRCLARGNDACVYQMTWRTRRARAGALGGVLGATTISGTSIVWAGGYVAGAIGALFAGLLGGCLGYLWDRWQRETTERAFERNRIAALERGLELRGELDATPGELTGTVLGGKYRIGRKIGSGGIGVVYAAEHTSLGHEVAVKVLRGAAAKDGGEIARLRREAYIQVHIEHPNVVRVLDLDQMSDGSVYVVMERLIGRSLADKLSREGVLTPGFAIPVFIDVCGALGAAHQKGVVHRDLKPGNVFLCEDGVSKVLDFGMSKLTSAESLTQAGYTLGTPEYMAPEQCIGAVVEPRTDLYALGVLMYEALTGELPIVAKNRRELLDLHQRQVPIPMRQRRYDLNIPEPLDTLVMTCLKKRVNERPKSAADLQAMLAAIPLNGLPVAYPSGTSRKAPPPQQDNRTGLTRSQPPPGAAALVEPKTKEATTLPAFGAAKPNEPR